MGTREFSSNLTKISFFWGGGRGGRGWSVIHVHSDLTKKEEIPVLLVGSVSTFYPQHNGILNSRDPFLERPGNLSGPKSYFGIKFSRKVGCVLTSNNAHFVSLADNFTVQFSNLLNLPSGMENKTA